MRAILYLFLPLAFSFLFTNAYAAKFYRHVPFTLSITSSDTVVVNYDFSEKHGIRCTSGNQPLWVDFAYKGRPKTARLPVLLQSAHIPEDEHEELADVTGQFTLFAKNLNPINQYKINCQYT